MIDRRNYLKMSTALLLSGGLSTGKRNAMAAQPIAPGRATVWGPILDLLFADDSGLAQWWLPELVLLGNTDVSLRARGLVPWAQQSHEHWSYEHLNPDGRLSLAVSVERIATGWLASLTVGNRTDEVWSNVVCPVCLLLRASGQFEDPDWKRTYYRSGGELLTYHGRQTEGGRDIYRMSLVKGQRQIERTERHRKKWGYTTQPSDDGIIGVVSSDQSTVLTTNWEPTHHLQANQKRTYSCIHANPYFNRIEPGESQTVRGCVLLTAGDLDEAWNETKRVMERAKV